MKAKKSPALKFGEPVTNICAGEKNPMRHCYFVKRKTTSYKNRAGITHRSKWIVCTDRKGKFWDIDSEVIYPGHLDEETCKEMFKPK